MRGVAAPLIEVTLEMEDGNSVLLSCEDHTGNLTPLLLDGKVKSVRIRARRTRVEELVDKTFSITNGD